MPSLSEDSARHVDIDHRPGRYLCFPDVCRLPGGGLLAVYSEMDRHVGTAGRRLLAKTSPDNGRTWQPASVLSETGGHCPRLAVLDGNTVACLDDAPNALYLSTDNGDSWSGVTPRKLEHKILDRILPLETGGLFTTGHLHRGSSPLPAMGQAPTEQMAYRSLDQGRTWKALTALNHNPRLVLCEASVAAMPDGPLLALLRENSGVGEPMYLVHSQDQGRTWSEPEPTPLIGHRPCLGLTASGLLLATYRNVGPDGGTAAWLGTEDELRGPYRPHGLVGPGVARATPEGLLIDATGGRDGCALYCLRPMTDPAHARAELRVSLRVFQEDRNGCLIRFGVPWRIGRGSIRPDLPGARSFTLPRDRAVELRLTWEQGRLTLRVDGRKRRHWDLEPDRVERRPILFGAPPVPGREGGAGRHLWTRLELDIHEPRIPRRYRWTWTPDQPDPGLPDAWARQHVLELRSGHGAWGGDYGYSGWVETAPGEFLCAYHHASAQDPGYEPGLTSRVVCTRFNESDFAG